MKIRKKGKRNNHFRQFVEKYPISNFVKCLFMGIFAKSKLVLWEYGDTKRKANIVNDQRV